MRRKFGVTKAFASEHWKASQQDVLLELQTIQRVSKFSAGVVALGALALGAMAIGALAIGRLVIGSVRIRKSEVCSNGGLARISPLLRNFVPVPYLPRLELCCLNVEPRQ